MRACVEERGRPDLTIYCLRCVRERAADKVRMPPQRKGRGRANGYANRCRECGDLYPAPPPAASRESRRRQRVLEKYGQLSLC